MKNVNQLDMSYGQSLKKSSSTSPPLVILT